MLQWKHACDFSMIRLHRSNKPYMELFGQMIISELEETDVSCKVSGNDSQRHKFHQRHTLPKADFLIWTIDASRFKNWERSQLAFLEVMAAFQNSQRRLLKIAILATRINLLSSKFDHRAVAKVLQLQVRHSFSRSDTFIGAPGSVGNRKL